MCADVCKCVESVGIGPAGCGAVGVAVGGAPPVPVGFVVPACVTILNLPLTSPLAAAAAAEVFVLV